MIKDTPPNGNMQSQSTPDDITLYQVGDFVQLKRKSMLATIPVGAMGKVVPNQDDSLLLSLLFSKGMYLTVDFNLTPYNINTEVGGVIRKVDTVMIFVGTEDVRPYEPMLYTDYVVMCVGNPLEEHVYAYFRPDDYSDPSWLYIIDFEEESTLYHYFKGVTPEQYFTQYKKDLKAGIVTPIPAMPKQALTPFHK